MKQLAASVVCIALLLVPVPGARAAIFLIPDGDVAGLVAAITTANTNGEDDVIGLAAGGTYTLTAVNNMVSGLNGLPSIAPDGGHTVTINGNSATIERDALAPKFRLFHVQAGANLTLNFVGLVGGDVGSLAFPANSGAAVSNEGVTTLKNVTVSDNIGDNGGAILNVGTMTIELSSIHTNVGIDGTIGNHNGATLTISQSAINDNDAVTGGAIFNVNATVMVTDSGFDRNRAIGSASSHGGAITNFSLGLITLTDVRFSQNSATDAGGAIFNHIVGTVNIVGGFVRMSGNAGASAAIHNEGTLTINEMDISNNTTNGIRNNSRTDARVADLHVENSTIVNNGLTGISNAAGSNVVMATHAADTTVLDTTISGHGAYGIQSIAFSTVATSSVSLMVFNSTITGSGGIQSRADDSGETATATIVNTDITVSGHLNGLDVVADGVGSSAATTLVGSTFSGSLGTGVSHFVEQNATGVLQMTNSTVSGNEDGVAQTEFTSASATLELRSVTINNSNDIGLANNGGSVEAYNTIVANSGTMNCALPAGTYPSSVANLSDDPSCVGPLSFSQVQDMLLGSLQNNGGPTPTHALLLGSPAIDTGNDVRCTELVDANGLPLTTDQRGPGFPRTNGPHCDVGAFEFQEAPTPAPVLGFAGLSLAVGLMLLIAGVTLHRGRRVRGVPTHIEARLERWRTGNNTA